MYSYVSHLCQAWKHSANHFIKVLSVLLSHCLQQIQNEIFSITFSVMGMRKNSMEKYLVGTPGVPTLPFGFWE
jgi:hypothetical protein